MLNYDDVGQKIKTISRIVFGVGCVLSFIGFIAYIIMGAQAGSAAMIIESFLILIVGVFASWLSGLFSYAFGQLVDNSDVIVKKINDDSKANNLESKIIKLKQMREKNLITDEEYIKMIESSVNE